MEAIPDRIKVTMGETLREAGVAAGNITPELLRSVLQEFIANDREIRTRERGEQHGESSQEDCILYRWQSDGRFHRLPENFEFPDISVLQAWLLYWEGHRDQRYPPFRYLQPIDVPKRWRSRFSDFRCMIRILLENVESTTEELRTMNAVSLIDVCHRVIPKLPTNQKKKQTKSSEWNHHCSEGSKASEKTNRTSTTRCGYA